MRTLHIIMPMAGEGSRFVSEGFTTPKPLIDFKGIKLFERALLSLEHIEVPIKYSFIVRDEHIRLHKIDNQIKLIYPSANIFAVGKTTRGAVETCMLAESKMETNDAILVLDCDLEFRSKQFDEYVTQMLSKPVELVNGGGIISFNSTENRYSYAKVNSNNIVERTAEKEVISEHALAGAYFFSKTESFIYAATKLLSEPYFNKPEFYLSLLYNYLINNGEIVRLLNIDDYHSYGTPEELKNNL